MPDWRNKLYYGDNLEVMREHLDDASVDLIYLDPPFNSRAAYDASIGGKNSLPQTRIRAFDDTWRWGPGSQRVFEELVRDGPRDLGTLMGALRQFLGTCDTMAYLVMISNRLVEMHRVLKPTGTIYLHCDPTASHYVKLAMDCIFGVDNFMNEIIWHYDGPQSPSPTRFATKHDVLLRYARCSERVDVDRDGLYSDIVLSEQEARKRGYRQDDEKRWYYDTPTGDYTEESIRRLEREGRIRRTTTGKPRVKYFLRQDERGNVIRRKKIPDVWDDIPSLGHAASSAERQGYQTQKPERLLQRIIRADSRQGDLVLDPFCGSGTTPAVSEGLKRRWLGVDITHLAISMTRRRLDDTFGADLSPYQVIGVPEDLDGARSLAAHDPHQFAVWVLDLVGARPVAVDGSIMGLVEFGDQQAGDEKHLLVQACTAKAADEVRRFENALREAEVHIGALITLDDPDASMLEEAASAGRYPADGSADDTYPTVQVISVSDLLSGRTIEMPRPG